MNKYLNIILEKFINEQEKINNGQLLTETIYRNDFKIITEDVVGVGKQMYITGIFSEFDNKNQNGRVYPKAVVLPEIMRYNEKYVKTKRAYGELDHPDSSEINLKNVSHRITDLWVEGNTVYGKALIGGPKGDAVKKLIELGGRLGVSSRSLGSLNYKNEVSDLQIICWDIVHEPSVSSAMMETIVESKKYTKNFDWINDKSGFVTESFKNEFKNLNKNSLLSENEKKLFTEWLIEDYFKKLI